MAGNIFGRWLTLTSFGESHGKSVGGVLDGFPAGIAVDEDFIRHQLRKRRTGFYTGSSARTETDEIQWLSGLHDGKSTGAPIAFRIANRDARHDDHAEGVLRPSHASYTYWQKYGFFDYDGGGRASARETVVRVVGGSLAMLLLKREGVEISAFTRRIGPVEIPQATLEINTENILKNSLLCPNEETNGRMEAYLRQLQAEGDTAGAVIGCLVKGVPCGLGEPVFARLQADLAQAMMGIGAAKGFEYGSGFAAATMKGSVHNDLWTEGFHTKTNHSGGIQGGISNGEDIYFHVAFKPIASIGRDQETLDERGESCMLRAGGRHDVCVAPRAVPVVEAMAALVLADHLLINNAYKSYTYK